MKRRLPGALGIMMSLLPSALLSQNLPPVAVDDTVYMCGNTVTIYVQNNDTNPDGDSLTLSIYAGSINGSFSVNGNAIDYTPNVGYTGTDTLVYSLCDDGVPPLCDTAVVIIHVGADYLINNSAQICSGDSIFLAGAWQNTDGSYTDWYTTGYGCDSIVVTTLTVNPNPLVSITASGSLNFCTGDSVTLTANGGSSFSWSTGATAQTITVFTAGTYSVVATDSAGCSGNASANVNVVPPPNATISPSGPIALCNGDSATLTASAGSSWLWSNGDTTQSIVVTIPGNYWVAVSNGTCTDTSASVAVNSTTITGSITAIGSLNFCAGDSVILTANGGTIFNWSTGATSQSITVYTAGTYSVVVSNASGCTASASVNVNVAPAPNATISPSGPVSMCSGDSIILTAGGGTSWTWSNGSTLQTIVVTDPGNYYVIVSNGSCTDTSASVVVNVNQIPSATITANGATTFCQGGSVTLTASSGNSYLWSTGVTTQSINVVTSGNYWVIVSNGNGCADTSASVAVTVNPLPVVFTSANGPTTFCEGGSVILTASNASTYLWSDGSTGQSITVTDAGTYFVTVTDANGCSATSNGNSVTVIEGPTAGISANGPLDFCQGESCTLTASGGTSWTWSNGETTQSILVTSAGTYYVIASNQCGSDTAASVTTTVTNGAPTAGINAAQSGYTFTFTDNSTGATSWNWNFGDNASSSEQNPVHEFSGPGSYQVTLIVTNACGSDTTSRFLNLEDGDKLGLYNAFSPNGDGYNDTWTIPMAEYYSDNTVTIVNRWGNEVWKASAYDNDKVVWNGQNLNGENLPDGSYYYIITYDGKDSRGWVFIKR